MDQNQPYIPNFTPEQLQYWQGVWQQMNQQLMNQMYPNQFQIQQYPQLQGYPQNYNNMQNGYPMQNPGCSTQNTVFSHQHPADVTTNVSASLNKQYQNKNIHNTISQQKIHNQTRNVDHQPSRNQDQQKRNLSISKQPRKKTRASYESSQDIEAYLQARRKKHPSITKVDDNFGNKHNTMQVELTQKVEEPEEGEVEELVQKDDDTQQVLKAEENSIEFDSEEKLEANVDEGKAKTKSNHGTKICKFFAKGSCRRGKRCTFKHEKPQLERMTKPTLFAKLIETDIARDRKILSLSIQFIVENNFFD